MPAAPASAVVSAVRDVAEPPVAGLPVSAHRPVPQAAPAPTALLAAAHQSGLQSAGALPGIQPAKWLNPADFDPVLGAVVRVLNAIGYVALRPKPVVQPIQLPSAPSQAVVAGTLDAFTVNFDPITAAVSSAPSHGSASIDPNTGFYTYTPDPSLAATGGADSFTVTVTEAGFHPIARLFGIGPISTTAVVSVTVPAQAVTSNGYYIVNTAVSPVRVAGYGVNQASLSPFVGYQIQSVTTTTDYNQTQALLQVDNGKTVTAYLNPTKFGSITASYPISGPVQSVVGPGGKLYVAGTENGRGYVTVIDPGSGVTTAKIDVGAAGPAGSPYGMALTPDGSRLYVRTVPCCDAGSPSVVMIDTASNLVAATGDPQQGYYYPLITISRDGSHGYLSSATGVLGTAGAIQVLDTNPTSASYNTITANIPIGNNYQGWGIALSPDDKYVYTAVDAGVDVVDTTANAKIATIPVQGDNHNGMAVSPDGKFLYVGFASSTSSLRAGVAVIDTAQGVVVKNIDLSSFNGRPLGLASSPDGKVLYVSNGGAGAVASPVVMISTDPSDPAYRSVVFSVTTNGANYGVAAVDGGAYVASKGSGAVAKINYSTNYVPQDGKGVYAVTVTGGSTPQCSATSGLQCSVAGSTVYLMDAPGNTYYVSAEYAQSQSNVLQTAVKDDLSNAVFTTKSSPVIGYTNPLKAQGFSPYINNTSSASTNAYTTSTTTTTATSYTFGVSTSANASAKLGELGVSATQSATETWGSTITDAQTYTQTVTQTVQPGETLYLYTETPVYRFYGDWWVQYGNTTYQLTDVWYDTPYQVSSSYPAYLGAYTCKTGSQQCSQVAAGDLSSYPSAWPSAVTLPVAESNQSNYNTA